MNALREIVKPKDRKIVITLSDDFSEPLEDFTEYME